MPDPSSAPVPGERDNDPMPPAWPPAEGSIPVPPADAVPDQARPTLDEPTPPADGLVEPTAPPEQPIGVASPPADGLSEPTAPPEQPIGVASPPADGLSEPITPRAAPPADGLYEPTTPRPAPPAEGVNAPSAAPPALADQVDGAAAPPEAAVTAASPAPKAAAASAAPLDEDALDEDGDDENSDGGAGDDEPMRRGGLLTKEVKIDAKTLLALVGVVVLVAVAFGAYWFGQRQVDSAAGPKATTTTAFRAPKDFVPLNDPDTGVTISIPANWVRYSTRDVADKAVRLTAGIQDTNDSMVLRVNAYSSEVTEANLTDQKNVFDQLLGGEDIKVIVDQTTKLGGLPALVYVYQFTDKATGKTGIHAHYFVFQGRKMVSLVLQALPEDRYDLLGSTFDAIANSLKVAPGPPPAFLEDLAGGTTTTVGPTASTSVPPTSASTPSSTTP